ncbi:hypothetical protein Tco_1013247 [Tanacetum coccineum]
MCRFNTSEETTNKENQKRDAKALFSSTTRPRMNISQGICSCKFSDKRHGIHSKQSNEGSANVIYSKVARFSEEYLNLQSLKGNETPYRNQEISLRTLLMSSWDRCKHMKPELTEMWSKKNMLFKFRGNKQSSHITVVEDEVVLEEEDVADQAIFNAIIAKIMSNNVWNLDSTCSNHMTEEREKFKNVDETLKSQVRLGDDKQVKVEGNGTVVVTLQGWERFIPDVHYTPEAFGFFKKFKALVFEMARCICQVKMARCICQVKMARCIWQDVFVKSRWQDVLVVEMASLKTDRAAAI